MPFCHPRQVISVILSSLSSSWTWSSQSSFKRFCWTLSSQSFSVEPCRSCLSCTGASIRHLQGCFIIIAMAKELFTFKSGYVTKKIEVLRLKGGVQILLCGFCPEGRYPPPLYGQNFRQKKGYGFGGYPPLPLYGHSPENFSSKSAKSGVFWAKK